MTQTPNRRRYLKSVGLGAAALVGLSSPVAAEKEYWLGDPPGYLRVYSSEGTDSPDDPDDFDFPGEPFFATCHPGNGEGLVGGDTIRITPDQNTLHHYLQFFAGFVMKDDPKPYVLVNRGESPYFESDDQTVEIFESRGQTVNFTARSPTGIEDEILKAIVEEGLDLPPDPESPFLELLMSFANKKWRAVATDRMNVVVDHDDGPFAKDAITRVDFYERDKGRPEYTRSLLYVLWEGSNQNIPLDTVEQTGQIITDGRLNLGGQAKRSE